MSISESKLPTSKQIKLIEAVTYMLSTIGKLRDQGISQEDFPSELLGMKASLQSLHSQMVASLPASGRDFLMRSAIKIAAKDSDQSKILERKLFQLGFGYFINGDVVQLATANENVAGFRVNKRGHISTFVSGEDDSYFEADLSRLVQPDDALKAKSHEDI